MKIMTGTSQVFDSDLTLSHKIDDTYTMNSLHFHDVFEIYFARTDGLEYFVNNRIYTVQQNDLFVFNHLDLHKIGLPQGVRYDRYIITFNRSYIDNYSTKTTDLLKCFTDRDPNFNHKVHLSDEEAENYLKLFEKADEYKSHAVYGEDVHQKFCLAEILIFVNRLFYSNHGSPIIHSYAEYLKIEQVINYINDHLNEKLPLDRLAGEFYINKYHLCKTFKNATGFTINEYIIYRRIIKASELLRRNYTVTRVAELSGFQNDSHFITTFKKIVGVSPKQYTKRD